MTALEVADFDSNYLNYGTGLLVSILLRYPEIGTISCCNEQQTLVLKFLVSKEYEFEPLKSKLTLALELFHKIEGRKIAFCNIEQHLQQEVDLIAITRDLKSITQNEINLIVEIIKNSIGQNLIIDQDSLPEEEIVLQEEVINHLLTAIRTNGTDKSFTALREDGRVLVFNG
ncbi:MAG: hypothetical protein GX248_00990 [Peptococcaceae bacterium]|jgi:hypothetical protein|nr:hypothetical protein [Peptococcaceae bacterium]